MSRTGVTVAAMAALAVLTSACGFSEVIDKRDAASLIERSYDKARNAGVATGYVELSVTLVKTRVPLQGVKEGFTTPPQQLPMTVNVAESRWAAVLAVGGNQQPIQAFDDTVFFQYAGNSGRSRPWIAYNVHRAYEQREQNAGDAFGSNLLNPAYLYQLLPGVLTGSIENLGTVELTGVTTTHYRANFDSERALRDAPRQRRETIEAALGLMGVTGRDAINGEVWIDGQGLPRKVLMRLREKYTRRDIIALNVATVIEQVGQDAEVPLPSRDQAARTEDLGAIARGVQDLVKQIAPQLGSPSPNQSPGGGFAPPPPGAGGAP